MFIFHSIPLNARPTYYYNLRSAILGGIGFSLYSQAGVVARKALHASSWEIALIAAAPIAGSALCIFWGKLSAGKPKMPWVVYSSLLSRIPVLLAGFVQTALSFTLLVSLAPFIWAIGQPAWASIMRSNYPANQRGEITGTVQMWSLVAASITAFASGYVLDLNQTLYMVVFPAAAIFGAWSAITFSKVRVRGERHLTEETAAAEKTGMFSALKDRRFMLFMTSFTMGGTAALMCAPVLTLFLTDELNVTFSQANIGLMVAPQVATFLTLPLWSRFHDRNNPLKLRLMCNIGFAGSYFLLYLAALFGNLYLVYASKFLEGVIGGLSTIIWNLGIMYFAPREKVSLYMGTHLALTGVRGIYGPFLGTWLMHVTQGWLPFWMEGVRFVFLVSALLIFVSCFLMIYMIYAEKKRYGFLPTLAQAEAMHEGGPLGYNHHL
jgi:MFS family permease